MNSDTIDQEKDEYIEQFRPTDYSTIKNLMATQKVILLYRQALEEIDDGRVAEKAKYIFTTYDEIGNNYEIHAHYVYNAKIGDMYVTEKNVVFVIPPKYRSYYENYIQKARAISRADENVLEQVKYMMPNIYKHFVDKDGNGIIVVTKPCKNMYPLREVWNYFGEELLPEHVASIMTRLYAFVTSLDIIGISHNGITMDNLFFSPGRTVEKGEDCTVEDMRIVGVFGGWFFSTFKNEPLRGLPREINDIFPTDMKEEGYSSFVVDELSIKRLARELLGDVSGQHLNSKVPESLSHWINISRVSSNAYEEFRAWERTRDSSFSERRFVPMDVSIY